MFEIKGYQILQEEEVEHQEEDDSLNGINTITEKAKTNNMRKRERSDSVL